MNQRYGAAALFASALQTLAGKLRFLTSFAIWHAWWPVLRHFSLF